MIRNFSPEEWEYFVGKDIPYKDEYRQCPNLPVPKRGQYPLDEALLTR